jgi:aryl-alcohol dehydrogenase-like predicted oxidoreductase
MATGACATREGTARYRDRFRETFAENHFRFEQDLWLSSVGIGTYLGDWDDEADRRYTEAVVCAVESGVNVIDTAANYRFQRSERSIGAALERLTGDGGEYAREEIVVCTKGGYLPFDGAPRRDVREYVEETFVRTGVADFSDIAAGSHCMTPRYLQHQIAQSLRNMRLEAIDVYYIHNPETQLSVTTRAEFETRLRAAFAALEEERAAGRIKSYGVATWNGFRAAQSERAYHSLERMLELAREAAGGRDDTAHGFRFIQLPFNLAMPEALILDNQTVEGARHSVLEAAQMLGVTVVASASIMQGKVARDLPETVRAPLGGLATDAQTAIQFVRSTPGITAALVGMSSREHVEENLQLARVAPVTPDAYRQLFAEGGV